ncbi:hypothetical protein DSM43518_00219 [Mycobacterium marinum]|uniref:hypothetical protein n=1 Tax=Mycobacterium marinum TaxID=1781 RepID=UPI000E3D254F|nr:hypothetical protein DSM43518_00219 [Mycobacterium marinum]RFZ47115.1 hypothetical protein MSS2_05310 [Mycobacterium marinum]RFZ49630.1 hypothetical protein MSS4_02602 [Mycobacterium marinum]
MVTSGPLDLTDARAKLDRAKELHGELIAALTEWQDSGGVEAQSRRSHQFVCYIGFAKVSSAPPINLQMRAGEVLHALRTALDYTAFQIHLAGGGTPDGPDARRVAFPIVTDPVKWESSVAANVRNAWPAAVAELRAVQQFAPPPANPPSPLPPLDPLLSRLATLGGTDKHRNLTVFATGAWSQNVIQPEMKDYYTVEIRINMPGPVLPTQPGPKVEVSRVLVKPSFARHPDDVFAWTSGIEFERPDPPELSFGFRANDGTEIGARELPAAIDVVESIVERFAALTGSPT